MSHVLYKLWADADYLYWSSLEARRVIDYQIRRLAQLSSPSNALFLPRPLNDKLPNGLITNSELSPSACPSSTYVNELKTNHDIPAFIVVKAALTLFLSDETKSLSHCSLKTRMVIAGHSKETGFRTNFPQCMDLAGSTLEKTAQLTPIDANESVI